MGVLKKGKALASYINRVIYNTIDMVLAFFWPSGHWLIVDFR